MENDNNRGDRSLPDSIRWQAAGHEVMQDRGTFRHRAYRKDFEPDVVVKTDGVPLIINGKVVKVKDLLPERADLALTLDGEVISQHEFTRRYLDWLQWFTWHEATDVSAEPIPSVLDFILKAKDIFSESGGLIPIHYDARKAPEAVPTHQYDPNSDKLIEIAETQATLAEGVKFLLEQNLNKRGPGRPPKELE